MPLFTLRCRVSEWSRWFWMKTREAWASAETSFGGGIVLGQMGSLRHTECDQKGILTWKKVWIGNYTRIKVRTGNKMQNCCFSSARLSALGLGISQPKMRSAFTCASGVCSAKVKLICLHVLLILMMCLCVFCSVQNKPQVQWGGTSLWVCRRNRDIQDASGPSWHRCVRLSLAFSRRKDNIIKFPVKRSCYSFAGRLLWAWIWRFASCSHCQEILTFCCLLYPDQRGWNVWRWVTWSGLCLERKHFELLLPTLGLSSRNHYFDKATC